MPTVTPGRGAGSNTTPHLPPYPLSGPGEPGCSAPLPNHQRLLTTELRVNSTKGLFTPL